MAKIQSTRINDPETLGLVLREARHRHNLSQDDIAKKLKLSQRYISELENGKPGKLMTRLFDVIHLLDISLTAEVNTRKK